jgi:plastocyanin
VAHRFTFSLDDRVAQRFQRCVKELRQKAALAAEVLQSDPRTGDCAETSQQCFPLGIAVLVLLFASTTLAQTVTVTAHVGGAVKARNGRTKAVIWLTPESGTVPVQPQAPSPPPRLVQHNKSFVPHLLVVPVGSVVEFPNHDPFFHNVFSLFEGKRFDLGLYEAGSTRDVHFDKPGVSYIFCNIHAEMSAVIIALATPYYGISDNRGQMAIPNVPSGSYKLQVWSETASPEDLNANARQVQISADSADLGELRIPRPGQSLAHKNKYGHDYDPPNPDSPAYPQ